MKKNQILALFFFSGISGLIYEVIWVRMLGLVFGTTVYAVSTVLTAFMAGLALGSFWFGRIIDKNKEPLKIYGYLELGIGIYCLLIPLLFSGLTKVYIGIYQVYSISPYLFSIIRFILCALVLLIPTTLMGATFPVISKFFIAKKEELGGDAGKLYSVNTFGAVLGCFSAGFILIPLIGVKASIFTAAVINICVGVIAVRLNRNQKPVGMQKPETSNQKPEKINQGADLKISNSLLILVLIAFAFSGFTALSFEVLWTRLLVMVLGNSVYAFTSMLTTFLCGIALGSYIFSRFIDKWKNLLVLFSAIEILIGVIVLIVTPMLGRLPFLFLNLFKFTGGAWFGIAILEFGISFLVMIIPTILFGAAFPLVTKIYTQNIKILGKSIGYIYSVNTLGCIAGSILTAFFLIPVFGIQKATIIVSSIAIIIGITLLLVNRGIMIFHRLFISSIIIIIALCLAILIPPWDRNVLDSGVYIYAQNILKDTQSKTPEQLMQDKKLLYYKEGVCATVSVYKGQYLFMRISGKTDASTSPDMMTQHLVAHLPLLFHKDPKTALVIGLASGTTLGSALRYPLEDVDCAEISPEVVEASGYFREVNHNALDDPRVKLHIVDGRNFIMATDKKYDVIISEPSNPWISGVSNLFTQDFYKICAEKLNDGGLMCQWFQFYRMSPLDLRIAINTFLSVFPGVTIWSPTVGETPLGDILMVGSKDMDFKIDFELLMGKFKDDKIKEDLACINVDSPYDLLSCFLIGEGNVYQEAAYSPINTDDYPLIEFRAPRNLYHESGMDILKNIREFTRCGFPPLENLEGVQGGLLEMHYKMALAYTHRGKHLMAVEELNDCLEIDPDFSKARFLQAMSYHHLGMEKEAAIQWKKVIEMAPGTKEAEDAAKQLKEHGLM